MVITVAAWSSRCRGPGERGWIRRRDGDARTRACEDPAGAVISARRGRDGPAKEPAIGDMADQRPRRDVREDAGPQGERGGGQRGQRVTQPGGLRHESVDHIQVDPGEPHHPCVRSHSRWPGSRTARTQRRTVDSGRSSSAAIHRYPVPRAPASNADPMTAIESARRRLAAVGSSTWVTRQVRQRARRAAAPAWCRRGRARCGYGRSPTDAAGGCIPGRTACRRPGRSRPGRGRRSRSSRHGGGTAHGHGLPAPPTGGASWCGSRSEQ